MSPEKLEDRREVFETALDRALRILTFTFPAPTEVEATEGKACGGELPTEQEVLLTVF
jgi:hypothetical protein